MSGHTHLHDDVAHLWPGPVLVLAGPGTGKTHTLARRIKWLVEDRGVSPDEITAITFTDEAARNMRERLSDRAKDVYLSPERQPRRIRTMHSLAYEVVANNYNALGFAQPPDIVPTHVVEVLLEDAAQLVGLPRVDGRKAVSLCRDHGLCQKSLERDECRACERYERILRHHRCVDYNDQLFLACRVLRDPKCGEVLRAYQDGASCLLVDEYQDINAAQFEFIQHLAAANPAGLYAVGDDNQSIYHFRGATPRYVREFDDDWPGCVVTSLPQSRRCPQSVLDAAAAVIMAGCSPPKCDPRIKSAVPHDTKVVVRRVPSDHWESNEIAQKIAHERGARDALVLIPRWAYAPIVRRALQQRRVLYECRVQTDETGLHILSELANWLESDDDDFALRSCLQAIVGNRTLDDLGRPTKGVRDWQEHLLGQVAALWNAVEEGNLTLWKALNEAGDEAGVSALRDHVRALRDAADGGPADVLSAAAAVLGPWRDARALFEELKGWVADSRSRNRAGARPAARVLTMRHAKGLEADLVFVVGLEEGTLAEESKKQADREEDYRLLYVAMTRAKQELHLYCCNRRSGATSYRPRKGSAYASPAPAHFLEWLPKDAVERTTRWGSKSRGKKTKPKTRAV